MGLRTLIYKKTGINLKKKSFTDQNKELLAQIDKLNNENAYLKQQITYSERYVPRFDHSYLVKDEFKDFKGGTAALQKLLEEYTFDTVLDIGAGAMDHSLLFAKHGKQVTAVDYGTSAYYQEHITDEGYIINKIIGDFNQIEFTQTYDCIWASHVLEHIPDIDNFLRKIHSITHENSIICITVPPFMHLIVGGHVSVWNAGLVLYRLVIAGFDCSQAAILSYQQSQRWENISVIIRKKSISPQGLVFDIGDLRKLKAYFPENMTFFSHDKDDPFDGNIARLNW